MPNNRLTKTRLTIRLIYYLTLSKINNEKFKNYRTLQARYKAFIKSFSQIRHIRN